MHRGDSDKVRGVPREAIETLIEETYETTLRYLHRARQMRKEGEREKGKESCVRVLRFYFLPFNVVLL